MSIEEEINILLLNDFRLLVKREELTKVRITIVSNRTNESVSDLVEISKLNLAEIINSLRHKIYSKNK